MATIRERHLAASIWSYTVYCTIGGGGGGGGGGVQPSHTSEVGQSAQVYIVNGGGGGGGGDIQASTPPHRYTKHIASDDNIRILPARTRRHASSRPVLRCVLCTLPI